jgi:hypothetical protein
MKKNHIAVVLFGIIVGLVSCQDPIFWTQQNEQLTPNNNLNKQARVFDVDANADGSRIFAVLGGLLFMRDITSSEWKQYDLPDRAHSIDVHNSLISLTKGIYSYDFVNMILGGVVDAAAERAFFDKVAGVTVSYQRDANASIPADSFTVNGNVYVGRYIGMLGGNVVSSVGVFNGATAVNAGRFRDPRGTDGLWLTANNLVGLVSGSDFSNPVDPMTGVAVITDTTAFNDLPSDGSPATIALVSVALGGYREIFVNPEGIHSARLPISSVGDANIYNASELSSAYIERYFYKAGILFALTTDRGLWSQTEKNGIWTWE